MKLEKLQLQIFKETVLKREQLMQLNGGGIKTEAGHISDWGSGECLSYEYGYDSNRDGSYAGYGGGYGTYVTYHNNTNVTKF